MARYQIIISDEPDGSVNYNLKILEGRLLDGSGNTPAGQAVLAVRDFIKQLHGGGRERTQQREYRDPDAVRQQRRKRRRF